MAHAESILANRPGSDYDGLIRSTDAMYTLCKKASQIREDGDKAAHPSLTSPNDLRRLQAVLEGLVLPDEREQNGIKKIIDILIQKNAKDKNAE